MTWRACLAALAGAYSEATLRGYGSDFLHFERWCAGVGTTALPAAPETVAAYLEENAALAIATLQRRLNAIRRIHKLMRLCDPTTDETVWLALRRLKRAHHARPAQALGLTAELTSRLIAATGDDLTGLRDRAMIAIGFDTLCRRSELVGLRLEDLEIGHDGRAAILVRRSKADPFGSGRLAAVSSAGLRRLLAWLDAAGIEAGPLFRRVRDTRVGTEALAPLTVSRVLKSAARRAGFSPDEVRQVSGHSLRVGGAQTLAARKIDMLTIMRAGGWKSINVVARYTEHAGLDIWQ